MTGGSKRWIYWGIIVTFVALLLTLNYRYKLYPVHQSEPNESEHSFRIITYNVNGKAIADSSSSNTLGFMQIIRKHDPDILCLQELNHVTFKQYRDSLDNYFSYTNEQKKDLGSNRYALYSKFPIRNLTQLHCLGVVDVPDADSVSDKWVTKFKKKMPVFSADLEVEPGKWITVFSCHLRSNDYSVARREMKEDSASWIDGIPLYRKNYIQGKAIRNWQVQTIRHHVDSLLSRNIPVIVTGDFNDFCGSDCLDLLMYGKGQKANDEMLMPKGEAPKAKDISYDLRDAWWERGTGFGITYDDWHLKLRLDHILVSKHFDIQRVEVPRYGLSDHYPVVGDVVLLAD